MPVGNSGADIGCDRARSVLGRIVIEMLHGCIGFAEDITEGIITEGHSVLP